MEQSGFFQVCQEIGRIQLQATILPSQAGLTVVIYGGDQSHIGAVALAVPRPSLADPAQVSATVSIMTMMGHKDDEIAKPAAERLAKELEQPVVVVAGVHLDSPTLEEIDEVLVLVDKLLEEIIAHFH